MKNDFNKIDFDGKMIRTINTYINEINDESKKMYLSIDTDRFILEYNSSDEQSFALATNKLDDWVKTIVKRKKQLIDLINSTILLNLILTLFNILLFFYPIIKIFKITDAIDYPKIIIIEWPFFHFKTTFIFKIIISQEL